MSIELLRELARVKALFQLRTIEAVMRGPVFPPSRGDTGGEPQAPRLNPSDGEQM